MQNKEIATDYRLDGSQFLFWQFIREAFLLAGAVACFAVSAYLMARVIVDNLAGLMEVMK